eukprot:6804835-Lingulodinium_polyedra.AAC.1
MVRAPRTSQIPETPLTIAIMEQSGLGDARHSHFWVVAHKKFSIWRASTTSPVHKLVGNY